MKIFYFHTPEAVPDHGRPDAAVVIDVLRATTTIAWSPVQAFADLDSLHRAADAWPAGRRLLAGERGGKRLEGFDLGNSPVAVAPAVVAGKRIFMSTTNGTRALERVCSAPHLFTACLPNRTAVARRLQQISAATIWIVGSGWEGTYSLEDSLAAGAVAAAAGGDAAVALAGNDELVAALALWQVWQAEPEACLRRASHGQRLISIADHAEDFACCAAVDSLGVVPFQAEPGVLKAH
ncbi:MAG: 2-phosphosulfolactate phosphatase family protein [Aphanocapsa feldmannii 277cI]|uniref:Probable 2-phosphosulfolactate phosphatase n=1 Tax=Aphanocapsa feldmannii 277cI TaxID=2507554 RepID=A0A524RSK5_9CHRO|nr:MAG: 2-phosphosulfolactate phosphatase family protein [Aphanocapsa feldmannii 277cI]